MQTITYRYGGPCIQADGNLSHHLAYKKDESWQHHTLSHKVLLSILETLGQHKSAEALAAAQFQLKNIHLAVKGKHSSEKRKLTAEVVKRCLPEWKFELRTPYLPEMALPNFIDQTQRLIEHEARKSPQVEVPSSAEEVSSPHAGLEMGDLLELMPLFLLLGTELL